MGIKFAVMTTFGSKDGVTSTFRKMGQGAAKFGNKSKGAFGQASKAGAGFKSMLAGVLSAQALISGAKKIGNFLKSTTIGIAQAGDEAAKTSRQIGMSAQALQELRFAADRQGISNTEFTNSMIKMNRLVGESRVGTGALTTFLRKSNPALLDQIKAVDNSEQAFKLLMNELNQIPNQMDKAALANAAFGRSGAKMLIMAEGGTSAIAALREEAKKYGGVISNETAANSEMLIDAMTNMKSSFQGVKNIIGGALIPAFTALSQKTADLVSGNKNLIGQKISSFFDRIKMAIDVLRPGVTAFIGAIKTTIETLKIFITSILGRAAEKSSILKTVLEAIGFVLKFVAGVVKNFMTGIRPFIPLLSVLIKIYAAWALHQWLVNTAMSANPIGIIIIGIVALVAAIGWLINNWEMIKNKIIEVWGIFVGFLVAVKNKAVEMFEKFSGGLMLISAPFTFTISLVKSLVDNLGNIKKAFDVGGIKGGIIAIGKALFSGLLQPVESLLNVLSKIPGVGKLAAGAAEKINALRDGLFAEEKAQAVENQMKSSVLPAPNQREVEARRDFSFNGRLDIAGAPEGSTFQQDKKGSAPIDVNLLGVNP